MIVKVSIFYHNRNHYSVILKLFNYDVAQVVNLKTACEMSQHGCPERLSNRSKGFQEDGSSQPTMEVLVETLTGTAFEMTVSPSDTIFAIKSKIYRVEGWFSLSDYYTILIRGTMRLLFIMRHYNKGYVVVSQLRKLRFLNV